MYQKKGSVPLLNVARPNLVHLEVCRFRVIQSMWVTHCFATRNNYVNRIEFYTSLKATLSYCQMLCMAVLNPAALPPVSLSFTPSTNLTSAITSAR